MNSTTAPTTDQADMHYHADGKLHSTMENARYCHECQAAAQSVETCDHAVNSDCPHYS